MRFTLDRDGANRIRACDADGIVIDDLRYTGSTVVSPELPVTGWPPGSFDDLQPAHFTLLAESNPEVVIFGSGTRIRFPRAELIAGLVNRGIGVEVMDTAAACRTYNILIGDGRRVVAALLIEAG